MMAVWEPLSGLVDRVQHQYDFIIIQITNIFMICRRVLMRMIRKILHWILFHWNCSRILATSWRSMRIRRVFRIRRMSGWISSGLFPFIRWANHTPTARKLTCTACGHKGFCQYRLPYSFLASAVHLDMKSVFAFV